MAKLKDSKFLGLGISKEESDLISLAEVLGVPFEHLKVLAFHHFLDGFRISNELILNAAKVV